MDIDGILAALHRHEVRYLLVGGVNFLLRHAPELTFDVDIWIADTEENRSRLNTALRTLQAEWGPTELEWAPVPENAAWLRRQALFCLTTPHGALDVFRELKGLEGEFEAALHRGLPSHTPSGIPYTGLSDEDMLRCQEALDPSERKAGRMEILRRAISQQHPGSND
jgi:hypothetical protein